MLKVIGWIDYDDTYFETARGTIYELRAVAKEIKENGYKFGGNDHEDHSCCCPVLSNGKALRLSWRSWGYVMAMAYDLKTKDGDYNYILWYMGEYGPEERVFPPRKELDYGGIKGYKALVYDVSDEELKGVNNAFFMRLVLPEEYVKDNELHIKDKVIFKHKDKVLLKVTVDPDKFMRCKINELFVKDDHLYLAIDSNVKFLDETKVRKLFKDKYNTTGENVVIVFFSVAEDLREDFNYDD